jgi:hypothetical protein
MDDLARGRLLHSRLLAQAEQQGNAVQLGIPSYTRDQCGLVPLLSSRLLVPVVVGEWREGRDLITIRGKI